MEKSFIKKGFLGSLFDFSFNNFVTPKIIGILYIILSVFAALGSLSLGLAGFSEGFFQGLALLLIVAPIVFALSILYIRVILELLIASFKTAENTAIMAEYLRQLRDK